MKTHQQIIQMCRMPESRYYETVFNMGVQYLEYETGNDDFYVSQIAQSKEFWQWWNKVVEDRNRLFLKEFNYSSLSCDELYYIWESLLNVKSLKVYPAAVIWSHGYENLIKTLTQKVK